MTEDLRAPSKVPEVASVEARHLYIYEHGRPDPNAADLERLLGAIRSDSLEAKVSRVG